MNGICGWVGRAQAPSTSIVRDAAACLASDEPVSDLDTRWGSLGGVGASIAHDSEAGLYAVIEGRPYWNHARLDRISRDRGAAAALLECYKTYGRDFPCEILGPFALAVLDERAEELTIAIDRMGIRPLCYASDPAGGLVFGSNTDAVLAHPAVSSQTCAQSVYRYVYFHVVPSPTTIFEEIEKLEPGQMVTCRSGSIAKEFYWQPEFTAPGGAASNELERELRQALRNVIARSSPDGQTGGFLSGGLDSSSVCGIASELVDGKFPAYTIGFAQEGYDEMEYARIAASHFDLDLRQYYVTPEDVADKMESIATAYDEPFGNSSALPALFCAELAKADGVTHLLAGDGGDELFGGNERYERQLIFERYELAPKWLRSWLLEPFLFGQFSDRIALMRKARRYVEQARVPMPERLQTYNLLHMQAPSSVFDEDFLSGVDTREPVASLSHWYERGRDAELIDKMLLLDWKVTLADNDLRKVNRMCELAGVQVSYPMLDSELVELSTRIPARAKLRVGHLRKFFKDAMSGYLPAQILTKEKHGFGLPFGDWLRSSARLRDFVMPRLDQLKQRGIFQHSFIDGLVRHHRDVHAAFYGNSIWVLTMLETWLANRGDRPARRHAQDRSTVVG